MDKVRQSILAPAVIEGRVIPNGVDLSVFRPLDREEVRKVIGISYDAKVLLCSASGIRKSIWKDYRTMEAAVALVAERLSGHEVLFIALGEEAPAEQIGQVQIRFVRYQKNPEVLANYYGAADLYIHAAKADTFPNTILEALACGTPVVATAVGGITEQVKSMEQVGVNLDCATYSLEEATGCLVPPGDAEAMGAAILALLTNGGLRKRLAENAAEDARSRFDLERQAEDYLEWYRTISSERSMLHESPSRSRDIDS
jgi:glycosyltransferase involved in cell wall biosynthesis